MRPLFPIIVYTECSQTEADYYLDKTGDVMPVKQLPVRYVFTKEELTKLLEDTFDHAIEWNDLEQTGRVQGGYRKNYIENKEQYIKSILP